MKKVITTTLLALLAAIMPACHHLEEFNNDPRGNFRALWTILDQHYCFFQEKDIDWDAIGEKYYSRVYNDMGTRELFQVCSDMLDELRDGHTNLSSSFNVSYYRKWWSDYPQNFNLRIIQENYFNFNFLVSAGMTYGILTENIGYIRYGSFSQPIGEGNLDSVLSYLASCNGLIIDIRDNGGGDMTNVDKLVARFITQRTLMGYIMHKTGPGHDDFSEPYEYYLEPAEQGRVMWGKPVIVLTNRSTFSAANNFVSIMQYLPQVKIAGARTGGGSGMPFNSELPNGWGIRFSGSPVLDPMGKSTETGIDPTPGCEVDMDSQDEARGIDTILEFAIKELQK
ncbi:MAG: S41 family peptidase [Barnesiella sp.]|nr:S41 family peptidase [Barnesiella sp.]MDE6081968.1 S41 family peptidase [Muribaculaceae bacterium]